MALNQELVDGSLAPDSVICNASDLDFKMVPSIDAITPKDTELAAIGWLWYNNLGVNNEVGSLLLGQAQPLRASRIKLFTADVSWRYGFSFSTAIKTSLGKNMPAPSDWRFPGLLKYGVVLYQRINEREIKAWKINETTAHAPQEIQLDPAADIFLNINDARGSYNDNSGSFDIYIQIIHA
jgi:hypothetical protein